MSKKCKKNKQYENRFFHWNEFLHHSSLTTSKKRRRRKRRIVYLLALEPKKWLKKDRLWVFTKHMSAIVKSAFIWIDASSPFFTILLCPPPWALFALQALLCVWSFVRLSLRERFKLTAPSVYRKLHQLQEEKTHNDTGDTWPECCINKLGDYSVLFFFNQKVFCRALCRKTQNTENTSVACHGLVFHLKHR